MTQKITQFFKNSSQILQNHDKNIQGKVSNEIDKIALFKKPENKLQLQIKNDVNKQILNSSKTLKKRSCRSLVCEFCNKKLSNSHNLSRHLTIHPSYWESINHYQCQFCGEKYVSKQNFNKHIKNHHYDGKDNRFTCDFDGKVFRLKSVLIHHMVHHASKVKCEICQSEMLQNSLLTHMKCVHSTEVNHQCNICLKKFKSRLNLLIHYKLHNKKFQCKICHKNFETASKLGTHEKITHLNPNAFKCEICGLGFGRIYALQRHQKIHDKSAFQFKCMKCDKSYTRKDQLDLHMSYHESIENRYAAIKNPHCCHLCIARYNNAIGLRKHKRKHHSGMKKPQCDLCGNYYISIRSMQRHMQLHIKNKLINYLEKS